MSYGIQLLSAILSDDQRQVKIWSVTAGCRGV